MNATPPLSSGQWRFWALTLLLLALLLWLLNDILLPFVMALAVAYFLNPPTRWLVRHGWPRWGAAALVLLSFLAVIVLVLWLAVPLVHAQLLDLLRVLPGYVSQIEAQITPWLDQMLERLSPADVAQIRNAVGNYAGNAAGWIANVVQGMLGSGMAILDVLMLVLVTPVVAFYLLRDWPVLVASIDRLLPRAHLATIRTELQRVDDTLAGFVRGQAIVCVLLGLMYGIGLSLVGLKFGFAIGMSAGLLAFIPYVGNFLGILVSTIVGLLQYPEWTSLLWVWGVFAIGQLIESNYLTPKLVGDRVGLHPVWVMFALFAGASLLGFVGVLIAVPLAAVLGVGLRFAIRQYRSSRYYSGQS